jgi:hypothetical protein
MSIDQAIRRGQYRYLGLMDTTVTVRRGSSSGAYNPATKTYTPTAGVSVYAGAAIVHAGQPGDTAGEEGAVRQVRFVVKFPALTDIERGDSVTVTASVHDSGLVGLTVWVLQTEPDEWSICRTAYCTDQITEVHP